MTFKVGDNIKVTATGQYGRVTSVSGEDITFKTPWNVSQTVKRSTLEASGFVGFMANESPDIVEVLVNSVSFALINRATGKGFMSKQNFRFLIEDAVYEFLLKGYTRETMAGWVGVEPLTGPDMESWFSSQDVKDAIVKSIPISLLDIVYGLFTKGKPGMPALWFLLKSAGAITLANVAQRKVMTKGSSYSPQ